MCHAGLRTGFSVHDVSAILHKHYQGRVQFHDGTGEIAPGVTEHWLRGHTQGMQIVRIQTMRQWVVLASDASHYYANVEVFRSVLDVNDILNGFDTIGALIIGDHWIPGHDPLVLERYPLVRDDFSHI